MSSEVHSLESLCSLIVDCPHSTPTWTDQGFVVLRNQNIKNGRLDLSSPSFTNAENFADRNRRAKPSLGDIVITREAPMGDVCMVPDGLECCLGQRQVLIRPNPELVNPRFLHFALQSAPVQEQIAWNEGTGSTVSNLRIPVLKGLRIPTPPRKVQDDMAETLGCLDDRIDNLRATNATLEAIAQAIFKSWFIDFDPVRAKMEGREPEGMDAETAALFPSEFEESELGLIPKGWRVGTLGEVSTNFRRQAKPSEINPETPYIGLEHMPRRCIALADAGKAAGLASGKFWYQKGDILFGKLRPYFHKVGISPEEGVCSTDIMVVRPLDPTWFGFVAMHFFSDEVVGHATQLSNGAKMPRTNWADVAGFPVALPSQPVVHAFNSIASRLLDSVMENIPYQRTLDQLRDRLLPRLISGKLTVEVNP